MLAAIILSLVVELFFYHPKKEPDNPVHVSYIAIQPAWPQSIYNINVIPPPKTHWFPSECRLAITG